MIYQKDKDLGWVIAFTSFLVFLLAAIIRAAMDAAPTGVPQAIFLANAHLSRAFIATTASFVRWVAVAGLVYGAYGIVRWPPGS